MVRAARRRRHVDAAPVSVGRARNPVARGNTLLRAVDRWAGVPLVALLGAARRITRPMRKSSKQPPAPRRVGLLKTAAIGDTTLLSAIVRDIAATPGVELLLFVGRDNAGVAALIEGPRAVVPIPVTRPWAAARLLRRHRLDLLIDCGSWPRVDAVLTALSGARETAGFRTARQGRHFAYDVAVPHRGDLHELEN